MNTSDLDEELMHSIILNSFEALLRELSLTEFDVTCDPVHLSSDFLDVLKYFEVFMEESVLGDAIDLATSGSVTRIVEQSFAELDNDDKDSVQLSQESMFSTASEPMSPSEAEETRRWMDALNGVFKMPKVSRYVYQVSTEARSDTHILLSNKHKWCSCEYYQKNVILRRKRWTCEHWAAVRFADALGTTILRKAAWTDINAMILNFDAEFKQFCTN